MTTENTEIDQEIDDVTLENNANGANHYWRTECREIDSRLS
jgi:hypothetical protein